MPGSLPNVGHQSGLPRLVRSVSVSRASKRLIAVIETADPFWQIDIMTASLDQVEWMQFAAFHTEYGDGMKTILWTPPLHISVPQYYWEDRANAALSNNGNLVSVTGGFNLAINSVANGLRLRRGDLISLATGDYRSLHRVMDDEVIAADNELELRVEPAVPPYIEEDAIVRFKDPELNVRLLPDSFEMPDQWRTTAQFTLVEVPK